MGYLYNINVYHCKLEQKKNQVLTNRKRQQKKWKKWKANKTKYK